MNKKIITKKTKAIDTFVHEIAKKPVSKFVEKIILFGSVARGEADKESDIDLMIFGKEPNKIKSVTDRMSYDILSDLGELIEPHIYPVSDLIRPSSYFILRAIETGREIYPERTFANR